MMNGKGSIEKGMILGHVLIHNAEKYHGRSWRPKALKEALLEDTGFHHTEINQHTVDTVARIANIHVIRNRKPKAGDDQA